MIDDKLYIDVMYDHMLPNDIPTTYEVDFDGNFMNDNLVLKKIWTFSQNIDIPHMRKPDWSR